MGQTPPLHVRPVERIAAIPAADWDACAGPDSPFLCHRFLAALEASESVTPSAGWLPQHLVATNAEGRILGVAPLYLKGNSLGEYVFDFEWAAAFERAGGRYYPKLQACIPFTPVTGRRLLVRNGPAAEMAATRLALVQGMVEIAKTMGLSSLHITFIAEEEMCYFKELGFLSRTGYQFHWKNDGYENFEAFLGALTARKRKAIRRERREAANGGAVNGGAANGEAANGGAVNGVQIRVLRGDDVRPHHWDSFYRFYRNTTDTKWGQAYLTPRFFHLLGETMADQTVLMFAERDGEPIAGALNFLGPDALYGRYWGAYEPETPEARPFLHFELCYYQAIDFAIKAGLGRVEAGAQGPHKVQRGYLPVATHSAHWLANDAFRDAVAGFLKRERIAMDEEMAALASQSPFRKTGEADPGV